MTGAHPGTVVPERGLSAYGVPALAGGMSDYGKSVVF